MWIHAYPIACIPPPFDWPKWPLRGILPPALWRWLTHRGLCRPPHRHTNGPCAQPLFEFHRNIKPNHADHTGPLIGAVGLGAREECRPPPKSVQSKCRPCGGLWRIPGHPSPQKAQNQILANQGQRYFCRTLTWPQRCARETIP